MAQPACLEEQHHNLISIFCNEPRILYSTKLYVTPPEDFTGEQDELADAQDPAKRLNVGSR